MGSEDNDRELERLRAEHKMAFEAVGDVVKANDILRAENEKFFKQAEMNARLLTENASLRAEIEKLRRDVRTAVMGDSAELADVKRENEKLREALKPFAGYVEQPERIYEHEGVRMTLVNQDVLMRLCQAAAAAIRESDNGSV